MENCKVRDLNARAAQTDFISRWSLKNEEGARGKSPRITSVANSSCLPGETGMRTNTFARH